MKDYYDTESVKCDKPKKGGKQNSYWLRCYYEYEPGEREVSYYADGSGYPGSDSDVNIYKLTMRFGSYESQCILHLIEEISTKFELEELEEQILNELEER